MSEVLLIDVCYNNEIDTLNVGDTVSTTTSCFDYNGVTDCFDNNINTMVTVKAIKTGEDYTNYNPRFSRTGGEYGYDYYKVIEILGE